MINSSDGGAPIGGIPPKKKIIKRVWSASPSDGADRRNFGRPYLGKSPQITARRNMRGQTPGGERAGSLHRNNTGGGMSGERSEYNRPRPQYGRSGGRSRLPANFNGNSPARQAAMHGRGFSNGPVPKETEAIGGAGPVFRPAPPRPQQNRQTDHTYRPAGGRNNKQHPAGDFRTSGREASAGDRMRASQSSRGNRHGGSPSRRGEYSGHRSQEDNQQTTNASPKPQPVESNADRDVIRIIPLGGVEEIGKNMTVIEYRDEIVVIDAGFQFPDEESPGVDYIVPDVTYLEQRKKNIKALFITHGHLDHTGGIPYVMEKMGNPTIYTRLLTSVMIKKRQDEFPQLPPLNLRIVEKDSRLKIGNHLAVRFFNVTHTIPDAMGIIIETPHGNIIFTGDIKIDHKDGVPLPHEVATYGALGKENNLFLAADSTNVERPGWSFAERAVHDNLRKIIEEAKGRLIIGTFSSLLERIIFVIKTADELGKKVAIRGRSMKTNVMIAKELGMFKVKPSTMISHEEVESYPPSKVIILATGAQGDELAALMRMSTKKDKHIKLNKTDSILLSSSIIPGNERSVQKLKDNLSRSGAKIIHYRIADVHSSGHANHDETLWVHKTLKPKFFMPLHGHHFMLRVHAEIAREAGIPESNVVIPNNGSVIEISNNGNKIEIVKETASSGVIMIDGLGTGDVKEVVIRDRQVLAEEGMFIVVAMVDNKTGQVNKSPDIISRGFIYMRESQALLKQVRLMAKKTIEATTSQMHPINFDYVRDALREMLAKFLFQKTGKRPIVIPVLIEV